MACINSAEQPFILTGFDKSTLEAIKSTNNELKRKTPAPMLPKEIKPARTYENEDDEFLRNPSMSLEQLKENLSKENFFMYRFKT